MSRAFPGPGPGHLKVPSHVCMESESKLSDALEPSALGLRAEDLFALT